MDGHSNGQVSNNQNVQPINNNINKTVDNNISVPTQESSNVGIPELNIEVSRQDIIKENNQPIHNILEQDGELESKNNI